MSDLVQRLRIKAGMIEMGEMIAWGSDSALMREAADALEMDAPCASDQCKTERQASLAAQNESQTAPAVQGEPVAWQFFQDGKWHMGGYTKNHRENTVAAGFPVRDLYAGHQPAEQQPVCPTCYGRGWDMDCQNEFRPATCPDCAGSGKAEHSITVQESDSAAPDVTALLEALESSQHGLHDIIDGDECRCSQCKFVGLRDAALAAYRKQGGEA